MRICVISRSYDNLFGGMESICQALCVGLVKRGHEVTVLTSKDNGTRARDDINGVRIHYAPFGRPGRYSMGFFTFVEEMFRKLNQERKFDIVHMESRCTRRDAVLGVPYVVRVHGTNMTEFRSAAGRRSPLAMLKYWNPLDKRWMRDALQRASAVVAISKGIRDSVMEEYSPGNVVVIHNGVDTELFKPRNRVLPCEDLDRKIILYAGRLLPEKGYNTLVDLMPRISELCPKAKLYIAGGDGESTDSIKYLGRVPQERMPEVYNTCDIFAFPTRRHEGFALNCLEAMACGKPVVVTPLGGEAVTDGYDGCIVRNDAEMVGEIFRLLENPDTAELMGNNARKTIVKQYSMDRMVEDHLKLYENIIGIPAG